MLKLLIYGSMGNRLDHTLWRGCTLFTHATIHHFLLYPSCGLTEHGSRQFFPEKPIYIILVRPKLWSDDPSPMTAPIEFSSVRLSESLYNTWLYWTWQWIPSSSCNRYQLENLASDQSPPIEDSCAPHQHQHKPTTTTTFGPWLGCHVHPQTHTCSEDARSMVHLRRYKIVLQLSICLWQ
jgi:hypothetical protein